ncbi:MAG: arylesterase [Gammaproteobacteria bacterium]|nr:arylesterase [Gammaproteobacteria bacterium]MCI0591270.1 arylesterase [Gammaproteobacteria bacterium]
MLLRSFCIAFFCVAAAIAATEPVILVLGDSLSAGYGIDVKSSWVARLQQRIKQQGYSYRVVNASISGDTLRGAQARVRGLLDTHSPNIVVVELGGNDGLRGLLVSEIRNNLSKILDACRARHAKVVLVSMRLPPNYGAHYNEQFEAVYHELAEDHDVLLAPFILEGIADHPELMQEDGVHPSTLAQERMLDNLWPSIVPLL